MSRAPRAAPPTLQLCAALAAAARGDAEAFARAVSLDVVGPGATGERHRCVPMLGEAAARLGAAAHVAAGAADAMRRASWKSAAGTGALHRATCTAVAALNEIGTPFALLKGAARAYAATPDAAYQRSDDIDVLVPACERDRVVAAMRARGYVSLGDPGAVDRRYRRHHHAVPLFAPDGTFPIELHDQLAPPGTISTRTDWTALEARMVPVHGPAGTALVLDPAASALHLAIHAMGLRRLRDVALAANILRTLAAADRDALEAIVRAERTNPIRLDASFALAASIAGVAWPTRPATERYVRWALMREDLPRALRGRCDAVDTYVAFPHRRRTALRGLVPWWSSGAEAAAVPFRVAGLCATNVAAALYVTLRSGRYRSAASSVPNTTTACGTSGISRLTAS